MEYRRRSGFPVLIRARLTGLSGLLRRLLENGKFSLVERFRPWPVLPHFTLNPGLDPRHPMHRRANGFRKMFRVLRSCLGDDRPGIRPKDPQVPVI